MKTIFIHTLLLLFLLASCSDEELVNGSRPKDGELTEMTFTLCIPQEERVTTRAAATESDVKELYVLVFTTEADEGTLVEEHPFTEAELEPADVTAGTEKVVRRKFTVKLEASSTPRAIYVVANANTALETIGLTKGTTTVENVKALTTNLTATDLANGTPFVMSGVKTSSIPDVSLLDTDFPLIRSVAKVTVESQADGFTYQSFQLWNGNNTGSILAGCTPKEAPARTAENGSMGIVQPEEEFYTYPYQNNDNKTFLIVCGLYKETEYYWRIDLKDDDGNTLDILPNHHYQVSIKRINAIGYTSADEAAKHPSDGRAEAVIYDHEPQIHNMITDGSFELGVTDTIRIADSSTQEKEFYVKIQGKDIADLSTVDIDIKIPDPQKDHWITIVTENDGTTPKRLNKEELSDNDDDTGNPKVGIQYRYSIKVDDNLSGGVRYGTVRVTANGLSRDIIVEQKTEFLGWHFPVSLTMNPGLDTNQKEITVENYWDFLFGDEVQIQKSDNTTSYIKLLGMEHNEESTSNADMRMGGKTRTRGFHFSVDAGQTFKYTFKLTNNGEDNKDVDWYVRVNEPYKSRLTFDIPDGQAESQIWKEDGLPHGKGVVGQYFTFTDATGESTTSTDNSSSGPSSSDNDAYRYGSGAFVLVLTTPATETTQATTTEITYDLYHTGIFAEGSAQKYNVRNDKDDTFNSTLASEQTGTYWYYYEVIKMGTYYWLDRNLGATSSGNYIQESDGSSLFGTDGWPFYKESAGELYSIVDGKLDNTESKNFADVCPPGYRVPTASEFNDLVRNGNFHIESTSYNNVSYWDTYYESSAFGRFYFPKNRMTYGSSSSGDGKAGYYWTRTEALGTSGTEQGHWLQFMKFMGGNGSLGRARTSLSGSESFNESARTGMSVRCISNNSGYNENIYTWEIYFKGYTHVFLYNKNSDNTIEYLNTWPGEMVCYYEGTRNSEGNLSASDNAALAKSNIFTFTSNTEYTELYVIFNKVTAKGVVEHTLYTQLNDNGNMAGFQVPNPSVSDTYAKVTHSSSGTCRQSSFTYTTKKDENGKIVIDTYQWTNPDN